MTRMHRIAATVLLSTTGFVLNTPPASAGLIINETYEFPLGPEVKEDFCGVEGFTVEQSGTAEGRFRVVTRGEEQLEYAGDIAKFTDTWTNVDTGESVTTTGLYNGNDLAISYNADGTVTILLQYSGTDMTRDADGDVIAHGAGIRKVQLHFDEAGNLLSRVIESHGRETGDFCAALEQAIG